MEYDSRYHKKGLFSSLMELGVLSILRSPLVSTLLLFLAGALFAAVIMLSYPDSPSENDRLPVVKANNEAIKIKPASPGGMTITGQDSTVYHAMRGEDSTQPSVENLFAPKQASEPLIDISEAVPSENTDTKVESEPKAEVQEKVEAAPVETKVVETKPETKPTPKKETVKDSSDTSKYVRSILDDKKESDTSAASAGSYYVQLASLKSEADARREWGVLSKKYGIEGKSYRIKSVDLGTKGVYYRVQVGGLSKSAADDLCKSVRAKSGGCFVVK